MVSANTAGKYVYTPEASANASIFEVTWDVDRTPRAYIIDDVLTAFLSSEGTITIDGNEYYTFDFSGRMNF